MRVQFEWDPRKAASNLTKHGVSFATAVQVFTDPFALAEQDRITDGELRWQIIGFSEQFQMLFVAYVTYEDQSDEVIRIISARLASRKERKRYESANGAL